MVARPTVTERLQELLKNELASGERLPPERRLAEDLGVSRSTLREGMRRLVDLGIVEARQGSGTYVTPIDLDDLLAARLRLEPYAARLAAARREPSDLRRLDALLERLRSHVGNATEFAAADSELHSAVVDASRSVALGVLLGALGDLLRHSRELTSPHAAVRSAAFTAHLWLVEAIRTRDGDAAEAAMATHLLDLREALGSRGDP